MTQRRSVQDRRVDAVMRELGLTSKPTKTRPRVQSALEKADRIARRDQAHKETSALQDLQERYDALRWSHDVVVEALVREQKSVERWKDLATDLMDLLVGLREKLYETEQRRRTADLMLGAEFVGRSLERSLRVAARNMPRIPA